MNQKRGKGDYVLRCMLVSFIIAGVLIISHANPVYASESVSGEILRRVADSAVFIRTERVFQHQKFPSSGSGFFIHQDGYVLTNWHVVADQVQGAIWNKDREINAKVLKLTVVVDSGLPSERELPAKIISRDRTRDLALLQVPYRPDTYVEIEQIDDVVIGDEVWIAGFPFGDLLAMDRKIDDTDAPNPAVTISRGMVTSLRRDTKGKLSMVQTDAALNPGNSGGAIINYQGHLVGVVFAGIRGGQGLGFGISPNRVREFINRQAVKISFKPKNVLSPPQPIVVTVEPILVGLGSDKGQVRFEGDDIAPVTVDLQLTDAGLEGTIRFPERIPGRTQPEKYLATVSLSSKQTEDVIRRRFAIKAVEKSFSTLQSMRDPARMMEDRMILANEMGISDIASEKTIKNESKKNKSLSSIAGSTNLQTNPSGSVIVNNNAIAKDYRVKLDHQRYRYITDPNLRELLQRYDELRLSMVSLEKGKMKNVRNPQEVFKRMSEERRVLGNKLVLANVLFCIKKNVYFVDEGDSMNQPCSGTSIKNQ